MSDLNKQGSTAHHPGVSDNAIEEAVRKSKLYPSRRHGVWVVNWRDPTGIPMKKQVPKSIQDEGEARRWSHQHVREQCEAGVAVKVSGTALPPPTIVELAKRWHAHHLADGMKEHRARGTLRAVEMYSGDLAKLPFTEVDVPTAAAWVTWLKKQGLAPLSVRNVVYSFKGVVVDGRGFGWIKLPENVFADRFVTKQLPKPERNEAVPLTADQAITLVNCKLVPRERRVINLVCLCTGLRISEASGLHWEHVDLEARTLRVEGQLGRGHKKGKVPDFPAPKRESYRTIPLCEAAWSALNDWRNVGWRGHFGRDPASSDPVFGVGLGEFGHMSSAKKFVYDLGLAGLPTYGKTQRGKVKRFCFHSTRATFLTLLHAADVHQDDIAILAGHRRNGVTLSNYVGVLRERLTKAVTTLPFRPI